MASIDHISQNQPASSPLSFSFFSSSPFFSLFLLLFSSLLSLSPLSFQVLLGHAVFLEFSHLKPVMPSLLASSVILSIDWVLSTSNTLAVWCCRALEFGEVELTPGELLVRLTCCGVNRTRLALTFGSVHMYVVVLLGPLLLVKPQLEPRS